MPRSTACATKPLFGCRPRPILADPGAQRKENTRHRDSRGAVMESGRPAREAGVKAGGRSLRRWGRGGRLLPGPRSATMVVASTVVGEARWWPMKDVGWLLLAVLVAYGCAVVAPPL